MTTKRLSLSILAAGAGLAILEPVAGGLLLAVGGVSLAIALEEPMTDPVEAVS